MQSNSPLLTQPESFNNFLLEKPFSLSLYRTNLIIAGLSLPLFFGFPVLCVLSISLAVIFISILVSMTSIAEASVFSFFFSGMPYISLFICLFIYLFIYLFIHLFSFVYEQINKYAKFSGKVTFLTP